MKRVFAVGLVAVVVVASVASCAGAGATAAANLAIGAAASAISKATGNCYAACPTETVCNKATGYCDPIPCRGRCAYNEVCDKTGMFEKCVPAAGAIAPAAVSTPDP